MVAMQDIDFPQHGPGYLTIADADPSLRQAAMSWVARDLKVYENDVQLGRAGAGRRPGVAAVRPVVCRLRPGPGPRPRATHARRDRDRLAAGDARHGVRVPDSVGAARVSRSSLTLARLGQRTQTVLRFVTPDGAVRAFDYRGNPGLVRLDPRWSQAALRFVGLGFEHILDGIDHLLFLACLVIPVRRLRPLVAIVTSFTIAHSVTLIASAFNFAPNNLWFPPLIETLIAVSILYMAIENALGVSPEAALAHHVRLWPGARLWLLVRTA